MNTKQLLLVAGVSAFVALLVFFLAGLVGGSASLGAIGPGPTHFQKENFIQGYSGGRTGQLDVDNAGVLSTTAAFTASSTARFNGEVSFNNGTNCGTASYTIVALGPPDQLGTVNSAVTTTVTVAGLAADDVVIPGWEAASATSTLYSLGLGFSATASSGVAVVEFHNLFGATSTASVIGTIRACYLD